MVGHVGNLLQDLQLEFRPEAVDEEVGSEHIWGNINHALNLVKISDKAVDTLGHSLLCLTSLMVCTKSLKVFWLMLVIQESLEGSPGYVSFTSSFQSEPHFLKVTFHIVDHIHDLLLVFMISNWLKGEEVFTTPDEHLEHFLVLAGVLLRVVERVVRFLEDHIRDVGYFSVSSDSMASPEKEQSWMIPHVRSCVIKLASGRASWHFITVISASILFQSNCTFRVVYLWATSF